MRTTNDINNTIVKRYDPTERYIRDYTRLFRDRMGIPEERLSIIVEGPEEGMRINGKWSPRRSRMCIALVHGGYLTVMYLGDWQAWRPRRKEWALTRWYGGTVMTSDEQGPYKLRSEPRGTFMPWIRRIIATDAERPLVYDDIKDIISREGGPAYSIELR